MLRTAEAILLRNIGLIPIAIISDGQRKSICEAINEARKEAAIEFFKWNAMKVNSYLEYIRKVKLLVTSQEIEEKLNEYEGATLDRRYELFLEFIEAEKQLSKEFMEL